MDANAFVAKRIHGEGTEDSFEVVNTKTGRSAATCDTLYYAQRIRHGLNRLKEVDDRKYQ